MDAMIQPGTSHAAPNTPQSFSNWQAQALDRTNDEVFLAAQNAINNQNNAQDARKFPCLSCKRIYGSKAALYTHLKYECGKDPQFSCPYCPHKSKHKGNLKVHIVLKHKVES